MILDIHTHHPAPRPEAVIARTPENFQPYEGQLYSIGIHPWNTSSEITSESWELFEKLLKEKEVVAIGECGIDMTKGGPLFRQMQIFRHQIMLAEKFHLPMIIHDVKAHEIIIGLKKEIKPKQNWVVHGFRNKPSVGRMLTDAGIWLSFGEKFNPDSLKETPEDRMLSETDESENGITDIIKRLSETKGKNLTEIIEKNTLNFLNRKL